MPLNMASWEGVGYLRDEMAYHWKQDIARPQKNATENSSHQCWPGKQEDMVTWITKVQVLIRHLSWLSL